MHKKDGLAHIYTPHCIRATSVTAFKAAGLENCRLSNSNWTEWSTIEGVIAQVISKSDEREVRSRFEITSTMTP